MVAYRRNFVSGGTYFFTVTLRDRRSRVLVDHVDLLREAFRDVRRERPFILDAIVVLPEHLHTVMTLPKGDADYSGRWRAIKSAFSRSLAKAGVRLRQGHRGEYRLWQRRFWEHTIRDEDDLQTHVDYIHYNPVKHALVERAAAWPYSSIHRFIRRGWIPADWGVAPDCFGGAEFGEPGQLAPGFRRPRAVGRP
jgi:putative transposase